MRTNKCHEVLGDDGTGKCSVPMWAGGAPAGFCDRTAYGDPINLQESPAGFGDTPAKARAQLALMGLR